MRVLSQILYSCLQNSSRTYQTLLSKSKVLKHYGTYELNRRQICLTNFLNVDIDNINNNIEDTLTHKEKILLVQAEYYLYKEEDKSEMPDRLTDNDIRVLVSLDDVHARKNHLHKIKAKQSNERLNSWKIDIFNYTKPFLENGIIYHENSSSYDLHIDKSYDYKLVTAKLFGLPIIIDNSFESKLSHQEKRILVHSFKNCFNMNRKHHDPFHIHLCNFHSKSEMCNYMYKILPSSQSKSFLVDQTHKNYTDIFPKKKLVYITKYCKDELLEFDPEAIYILGNVEDTRIRGVMPSQKAQREGIKMPKMPLQR